MLIYGEYLFETPYNQARESIVDWLFQLPENIKAKKRLRL